MAEKTGISWTDATFNPWVGCTKISPACDNCYAESYAKRTGQSELWQGTRRRTSTKNWNLPLKWNARPFYECSNCGWRGDAPEMGYPGSVMEHVGSCPNCDIIYLRNARRRVFCASLADVFDNEVPPSWRADLFSLILNTQNLDWLLLTKRIGNVSRMLEDAGSVEPMLLGGGMPGNVWLGATVVTQEEADRDIPKLLNTPARIRFLSIEPILGPVDLRAIQHLKMIDWIITGGESGPNARPMHPAWVRSLRDQCAAAGVPFHFKQWGEWAPNCLCQTKKAHKEISRPAPGSPGVMFRCGKKSAGRLLDGIEHNEFPGV